MNNVMKKLLGSERSEVVLRVGSLLLFLFLWYAVGVKFDGDSAGYIEGHFLRSPLYPLIIRAFALLDDSLHLLILFQLLLGLCAIHVFLHTIRKIFDFGFVAAVVVFLFISLPYYFVTLKQQFYIGNVILTGALCYPLFLLAASAIVQAVLRPRLRYYLYFILLTALLILTRRQFLFLYPFFVLVWLTLFVQKERVRFSRWLLLAVFVLSIVATNLIERTYQYIRHGAFSTVPFTGRQLLVMPMFVAKADDGNLFDVAEQREIFTRIYGELEDEKISFAHHGATALHLYSMYEQHYNDVSHHVIPRAAREVMGAGYDEYAMDETTTRMSLVLIRHNLKDYLKLYLKNIEVNAGKKAFVLFLLLLFVLTGIHYIKHRSRVSLIVLLALILQFGNYMLIALVEPIIWRYTVYTNQVLFVLLALCVTHRPPVRDTRGIPDDLRFSAIHRNTEGARR